MHCCAQYLQVFFDSLGVTLDSAETPFAKTPAQAGVGEGSPAATRWRGGSSKRHSGPDPHLGILEKMGLKECTSCGCISFWLSLMPQIRLQNRQEAYLSILRQRGLLRNIQSLALQSINRRAHIHFARFFDAGTV